MAIGGGILVVGGTTSSTDIISNWLLVEDWQVYTADSGSHALAKVQLLKPDIVVTGIELPDMSGYDLCKRIKSGAESQFTLVLFVSSIESDCVRLRATEVGADDYIGINVEHHILISKVKSLLRVKRLSNQLRLKYAELEEKNTILEKQLKIGMQVQRALIPDIDMSFKNCRLLSRYYPSMEVGGDFYNMLRLTEHSFGIVMGDVSGHGIAAAFLTAMLNSMIANLSPKYFNPDQLLFFLNNELYSVFEKSTYRLYACVFYAVVNTKDKYVRYANAGQSLPFYVDVGAGTVTEMESSGHPIGLLKDSRYEMKSLGYNRNDLLLFHTDGLQDAFYKNQPDEFTRRVREILSEIRFLPDMQEILDVICNNFYDSAASETARMEMDDVSMILCRL